MPYGTVNADVIQSSVANTSLGAGNASIMKNRIQNGAMVIDQRNAGASITANNGAFPVDRFRMDCTQSSKGNCQQTPSATETGYATRIAAGFTNYFAFTSTSAYSVLSSDEFTITQNIEGYNMADLTWGTASAKTVTLSFLAYSSLTGAFGGSVSNQSNTRSYPFSYTISSANTWTTVSVTIPGETSGTWLSTNGIGMRVFFSLGCGSTYSGTAGSWASSDIRSVTGATSVVGTSGATFYITGVQLEVGSSATGFEYRQYGTELALCQRYFTWLLNSNGGSNGNQNIGSSFNSTRFFTKVYHKVSMRTPPTVTANSFTGYVAQNSSTAFTTSAINVAFPQPDSTGLDFVCSGMTGGYAGHFDISTGSVSASAEL